jgi:hypothetical protein
VVAIPVHCLTVVDTATVAAKLTPHTYVGVSPSSYSLHPIQPHRLVLHLSCFNETGVVHASLVCHPSEGCGSI